MSPSKARLVPESHQSISDDLGDASVLALNHEGGVGLLATGPRPTCWSTFTDRAQYVVFMMGVFKWQLVGTALSWCIFDVVFYANSLFTGTVLSEVGFASSAKPAEMSQADLARLAAGSCIVAAMGVPGYFVALALIDRMGRRPMQLMGFAAIAVLYAVLAGSLAALVQQHVVAVFLVLYGLTFFFANFGPNMTTYVVPAESFGTKAKATCHGISAASGKVGAAVGGAMMTPILSAFGSDTAGKNKGLQIVLAICAAVSVAGFVVTWFLTPETRDTRIEDLDKELRRAEGVAESMEDEEDVEVLLRRDEAERAGSLTASGALVREGIAKAMSGDGLRAGGHAPYIAVVGDDGHAAVNGDGRHHGGAAGLSMRDLT